MGLAGCQRNARRKEDALRAPVHGQSGARGAWGEDVLIILSPHTRSSSKNACKSHTHTTHGDREEGSTASGFDPCRERARDGVASDDNRVGKNRQPPTSLSFLHSPSQHTRRYTAFPTFFFAESPHDKVDREGTAGRGDGKST